MKKLVTIICATIFFGCSTQRATKETSFDSINRILSIEEYEYCYYIKGTNQETQNLVNIISYKKTYFDKYNLQTPFSSSQAGLKTIIKDNNYTFNLTEMRFNVSDMEQLGASVIIENDTIWKGKPTLENRFYKSKNSIGLTISQ